VFAKYTAILLTATIGLSIVAFAFVFEGYVVFAYLSDVLFWDGGVFLLLFF
jgi:hypothetical protein